MSVDDSDSRVGAPTRRTGSRVALALGALVVLVPALIAVVVYGVRVGPIDRPSLAELHVIADKLEQVCPETRYWGGNEIDVIRARVRGPLLGAADDVLTERERSFVDDDRSRCNIADAINGP